MKKRAKKTFYWRDTLIVAFILIIGIFIGLLINIPSPEIITTPSDISGISALSLLGFEEINVSVSPNVITLDSGCYELTMVTTNSQTFSIISGIEGERGFRPNAHDLMDDVIKTFGMDVMMTKIDSLKEGTYFAKLFIRQGNRILSLDSKPSDAISINVRTEAPIYINTSLMEKEGIFTC